MEKKTKPAQTLGQTLWTSIHKTEGSREEKNKKGYEKPI